MKSGPSSALAGFLLAAGTQSATAAALLVAAFAASGVIAPAYALAAMLGADLGSSLVAQVLSLNVHWLAPVLILVGVVTHLSAEAWRHHGLGRVAIGLGGEGFGWRADRFATMLIEDEAGTRDGEVRHRFGRIAAEFLALRFTSYRMLTTLQRGGVPGPEGALAKVTTVKAAIDAGELIVDVLGPGALEDERAGRLVHEASVLGRLGDSRVIRLARPDTLLIGGRTILVLDHAGEQTVARKLRELLGWEAEREAAELAAYRDEVAQARACLGPVAAAGPAAD